MPEGNGTTELNAAEAILAEAAAITPADYIQPEHVPAANHRVIGDCTAFQKQLHTLAMRTMAEIKPLNKEVQTLTLELQSALNRLPDIFAHATYLARADVQEKMARLKAVSDQLSLLQSRSTMITAILSAETVRLFPAVTGLPCAFDTFGRVFVISPVDEVANAAKHEAQAASGESAAGEAATAQSSEATVH